MCTDAILLARPWFWPVSLVPYYVGLVLGTHHLAPGWHGPGWSVGDSVAGAVVVGPLLWVAVLAINDAHDVDGDRRNPRKLRMPVAAGRMLPRTAARTAELAAFAALVLAMRVGPVFAAGTASALALGWAYSVRPIRLKERPGLDVAANAVAIGALGPWSGWSVVAPPQHFPWSFGVLGTLVGAALYVPTTLVDRRADAVSGYRTVAVRIGARATYLAGLSVWAAAAVLSVILAATGTVLSRRMLPAEILLVPALVGSYHLLLRREQSFPRIAAVAALFLVPAATFVLTYVRR